MNNHKCYEHFIIQGDDFKARLWMEPCGKKARFFKTGRELACTLFLKGKKCFIFRYMNSDKKVWTDIKYTSFLVVLGMVKKVFSADIYWIMHNVDKESIDKIHFLTGIRRAVMKHSARKIFVTDPLFKELYFYDNPKVEAISFGEKQGGWISTDNLTLIKSLKYNYDQVVLCLGAKGEKYTHFSRLAALTDMAALNGKRIAFILPNHVEYKGSNAVRVDEPNIDEKAIAPYVDFIYRINDDVSMPYTLYAACSARIPIVTSKGFFTYRIIQRYGIGFDEAEYFYATEEEISRVKNNMALFIARSSWESLANRLSC